MCAKLNGKTYDAWRIGDTVAPPWRLSCDVLSSLYCTWYACTFSDTIFKMKACVQERMIRHKTVDNFTREEQTKTVTDSDGHAVFSCHSSAFLLARWHAFALYISSWHVLFLHSFSYRNDESTDNRLTDLRHPIFKSTCSQL